MKEELDTKLFSDFPYLFADRFANMKDTCLCWGFECRDGWEPLIRKLAEKLEPLCKKSFEEMSEEEKECDVYCKASQVKEKFGTLSFYMTNMTEEMYEYIKEAEKESEVTCEICGNVGKLRGKYWLYTACDEHTEDGDKYTNSLCRD